MRALIIKTLEDTKVNILKDLDKAVNEHRPVTEIDELLDSLNEVNKLLKSLRDETDQK